MDKFKKQNFKINGNLKKYLNNLLSQIKLNGKVIDIGGQKLINDQSNLNKNQITEFLYLNTDEKAMPDILASQKKFQ